MEALPLSILLDILHVNTTYWTLVGNNLYWLTLSASETCKETLTIVKASLTRITTLVIGIQVFGNQYKETCTALELFSCHINKTS